ncbi:hypothetical protein ABPG77_007441 [Micractinium sp. CCAP 211/92]
MRSCSSTRRDRMTERWRCGQSCGMIGRWTSCCRRRRTARWRCRRMRSWRGRATATGGQAHTLPAPRPSPRRPLPPRPCFRPGAASTAVPYTPSSARTPLLTTRAAPQPSAPLSHPPPHITPTPPHPTPSFTLLISKGYLRTVETMRTRLMASEWELGQRPIALQTGVARFEQYCADNKVPLSFEVISELYEDPTDLRGIEDPFLRMQARSTIMQAEAEERVKAWAACTAEAQRLAERFSEAEFISKIIPDPIETGVVDALRRIVTPLARGLSA